MRGDMAYARDRWLTHRWNHHHTIGGKAARSVKGPSKDEVQNRVPLKLLLGALQALPRRSTVGRPRAARPRRRRNTKSKARGRTSGTTKGDPTVLCRFMGAQAGHHQLILWAWCLPLTVETWKAKRTWSGGIVNCNRTRQMWMPEVEGLAFVPVLARPHSTPHFSLVLEL